jgi:hypothetical protein
VEKGAGHTGKMTFDYGRDVLSTDPRARAKRVVPEVPAHGGLVVECVDSGWCGAVVALGAGAVELEDRHGRRRTFPLERAAFLVDGQPVTLVRPPAGPAAPTRTASGSVAVVGQRAQVAKGSRIWVEGIHDAAIVERVWGDDLRVEGVVVDHVRDFAPTRDRRLGVLLDHLVPGSKESRIAAAAGGPLVKVLGHPYVDVWEAVKPSSLGIAAWPKVPRGTDWKTGVCATLGWGSPQDGWRRVLAGVSSWTDLETPLLRAVEELVDWVTGEP